MSDRFAAGARLGDYWVEREIAIEEIAVLYLATHVVLPRQVYIKVAHPGSRVAAVQVLREACIHEGLAHTGIPRVFECGALVDRRTWCALEVLAGTTLKQFLGNGLLAPFDLVVVLRDVADILGYAHERGVVHRRLTTTAIVRTQHRRTRYAICDWSDARTLDADAGVVIDPKDDVHALGTIAFRALTGRPAEPGLSAGTYCPSAPAELISLIDQMLAEPTARPTANEVWKRALWLNDMFEVASLTERPRKTSLHSILAEEGAAGEEGTVGWAGAEAENDDDELTIPISRMRSS